MKNAKTIDVGILDKVVKKAFPNSNPNVIPYSTKRKIYSMFMRRRGRNRYSPKNDFFENHRQELFEAIGREFETYSELNEEEKREYRKYYCHIYNKKYKVDKK